MKMKIANRTYRESFYEKKAIELNVESVKEAKQIYEGIKHYTRLLEKYGDDQIETWIRTLQKENKGSVRGRN